MTEKIYNYDPAEALDSQEAIVIFMADAFETGDAAYISKALGIVARAKTKATKASAVGKANAHKFATALKAAPRPQPIMKPTIAGQV